jgi:hypothetical protein
MKDYNIQIVKASHAKDIHYFKKTKYKLLKPVWFNKICKTHQLTAKYINIKSNGNNQQNLKAAATYRLNQELTPEVNRVL